MIWLSQNQSAASVELNPIELANLSETDCYATCYAGGAEQAIQQPLINNEGK